jgi:hypothetical protein
MPHGAFSSAAVTRRIPDQAGFAGTIYMIQVCKEHDPDPRRSMPLPRGLPLVSMASDGAHGSQTVPLSKHGQTPSCNGAI